jgi:two-component system chemotaxis response regulator CheY
MDHGSISRFLNQHFDVSVEQAHGTDQALDKLRNDLFNLVLVNRVFDQHGGDGMGLIQQVCQDDSIGDIPVMLVSNYPDYQAQAVALGAAPGFGKSGLNSPDLPGHLATFLSDQS